MYLTRLGDIQYGIPFSGKKSSLFCYDYIDGFDFKNEDLYHTLDVLKEGNGYRITKFYDRSLLSSSEYLYIYHNFDISRPFDKESKYNRYTRDIKSFFSKGDNPQLGEYDKRPDRYLLSKAWLDINENIIFSSSGSMVGSYRDIIRDKWRS